MFGDICRQETNKAQWSRHEVELFNFITSSSKFHLLKSIFLEKLAMEKDYEKRPSLSLDFCSASDERKLARSSSGIGDSSVHMIM